MGSINKSHNESDGGILLFNGELILLYCDSVQCEIGGKESVKGRLYLTTHRMVMIVTPYRQNSAVKSLCAPFCAIVKCNVEQPIFGANYIEATVRDENDSSKSFSFKLRFSKGGAIEFAMAMNRAVAAVGRNFNPNMPPPPAYTPSPSAQYYQAPPTVYAPGYNSGIQMPVQQFPDQPPIGFIYASSAPPPYPGLGGMGASSQPPPPYSQPQQQPGYQQPGPGQQPSGGYPGGYPSNQAQSSYPSPGNQAQAGYPANPAQQGYPQQGYPGQQPPQAGYYAPQQPSAGYPQAPPSQPQQTPAGNPYQQGPGNSGYPSQQPAGYPQQPGFNAGSNLPASSNAGYPDLSTAGNPSPQPAGGYPSGGPPQPSAQAPSPDYSSNQNQASWPSAPSFNPNWQDDKKSA